MDYIDGYTFEHLIFKMGKKFSVHESLKIAKQLLEIVITIHNHGIVHRDLRIPNILLRDGELYIIDFGLACYMKDDIRLDTVNNPKKRENYTSDLYYIGHFLLYLLYSSYTHNGKKAQCWQDELQLPLPVQNYIEHLLLIQPAFPDTLTAYEALPL
jgi:serine/threonine-protein kinase